MKFENSFKKSWDKVVKEDTLPRYMNTIKEYDYITFKNFVLENNEKKADEIVNSLYSGDVYILRNVYSDEFVEDLKTKLFKWGQDTESAFHKTYENVPNFHRIVDESVNSNYAMKPMWHIFYLFPWNQDHMGVYEEINKRWNIMKMLSGYQANEFSKNTPKDGIIDRIHFYQYPSGGGYVETHSDPYKINRTIMTTKLSTRGEDYQTGGIYFFTQDDNKINLDDQIQKGDMFFCFPTLIHGCDPVDPGETIDWNNKRGRWLLGPWSIDSDEVKDRHTSQAVNI